MEPLQAIILGIIQGLTEFLPVSSSGHLVIFQHLFGLKEPELFFDISVHFGTLIAVVIFFWKDIQKIIITIIRFSLLMIRKEASFVDINENPDIKMAILILIGSIPTAIIGLLFHKAADQIFSLIFLVGCALMVTALLLWITRQIKKSDKDIAGFSIKDALIVGVVQGMAITPGISRSGSTIASGLFLGLNKEISARYSFLLSIPAIVGAEILSIKDATVQNINMAALLGTLTAGIVGYMALKLLVYMVKKGQLYIFAPYCCVMGIIAFIWGF